MPIVIAYVLLIGSALGVQKNVDFNHDVAPILRRNCLRCHNGVAAKGGFRMDSVTGLFGNGKNEAVVVRGVPSESELVVRITSADESTRMPPKGLALSVGEIATLRDWIQQGADVPESSWFGAVGRGLWSVQPINSSAIPWVQTWGHNEVDAFVKQRLDQIHLAPSPLADRYTLIRRIYHVMLGLPPSPTDVKSFIEDSSPDAVPRLIDRVLKSPRYGEHWAQHWLDCVRFAESTGYEVNTVLHSAYYYRDYVIRSFNEDKPYDRFVQEQLAGDLLGVDAATGFLVAGPNDGNRSPDPLLTAMQRQDSLDEMIKSTSAVLLGLTVGCARCHDHKFDPISQKDYYAMQAVFAGVHHGERRLRGYENNVMQAQADGLKPKLDRSRKTLKRIQSQLSLKGPIDFLEYEEQLNPMDACGIQMRIQATNNGSPVELDDIEVWSVASQGKPSVNVAHRDLGAWAESSPTIMVNQGKTAETLLDGQRQLFLHFQAKQSSGVWIKIHFEQSVLVDRIVIKPRGASVPVDYRIDLDVGNGKWLQVVDSRDRFPHLHDLRRAEKIELKGINADQVSTIVTANQAVRELGAEYDRLRGGPQIHIGRFEAPPQTHVLRRGEPFQKAQPVGPNVPAVLGDLKLSLSTPESKRRLQLARAITHPANPLISRVIVNRLWQYHFGIGIVDTPSDFGFNGGYPTHPGLLDWLSKYLVEHHWSLKAIHRKILLSATFQQESFTRKDGLARDADVRWLWRYPPRRLEAEAIRDSILAASGRLNKTMYGPGFEFFEDHANSFEKRIPRETFDLRGWRRMIYGKKIRLESVGIFGLFDCPDASQMSPRRFQSTTTVQALSLFNSQFSNRHAGFLAELVELQADANADLEDMIHMAVYRVLARPSRVEERTLLKQVAEQHGLAAVCRILFNTNEFLIIR